MLKKFVGAMVTVSGTWQPGEPWVPTEEEKLMPMPVDPDNDVVIRGDGLLAASIGLIER